MRQQKIRYFFYNDKTKYFIDTKINSYIIFYSRRPRLNHFLIQPKKKRVISLFQISRWGHCFDNFLIHDKLSNAWDRMDKTISSYQAQKK